MRRYWVFGSVPDLFPIVFNISSIFFPFNFLVSDYEIVSFESVNNVNGPSIWSLISLKYNGVKTLFVNSNGSTEKGEVLSIYKVTGNYLNVIAV